MRRLLKTGDSGLGQEALSQLDALIEHLEESGFAPIVDEDDLTIELTPCPHAAAPPAHRSLLCQVHRGLMQSVLAEAGGPLVASCVHAARSRQECVVQLESRERPEASAA